MEKMNIFERIPDVIADELFEGIVDTGRLKIERIISDGHASPPGYWYDQERSEWVILLKGSAGLLFEGSEEVVVLEPGDHINIAAHRRHRVEWTDPSEKTIWVAVHY